MAHMKVLSGVAEELRISQQKIEEKAKMQHEAIQIRGTSAFRTTSKENHWMTINDN